MDESERIKFINDFTEELLADPRITELFNNYNSLSIKSVLRDYAQRINSANQFGDAAEKAEKDKITEFIDDGMTLLKAILLVKIFHKECEWRAGLFDYPDITHPNDFSIYASDPFNCDFIEPITETEVVLMQKFIASDNFDMIEIEHLHWTSYEDFQSHRNSDDADSDTYPEWYSFYDLHKGTSRFFNLPDVRGEKIEKYRDVYFENLKKENEQNKEYMERQKNMDQRAFFNYKEKPLMFKKIDDILQSKEKKIKLKYYDMWSQRFKDNNQASNAIHYLSNYSDIAIPIKDADTWQQGLINALDAFNRKSMIEALPEAFNNYRTQRELNLPSEVEDPSMVEHSKHMSEVVKRQIMKGRKLLGEPENFDFLFE